MTTEISLVINATDKSSGPIKKVDGAIAGLGKTARTASGGLSAMTVALGTVIGNLATGAISSMFNLGASVVSTGIDFNNLKQQADIAFTTMLGSGEKAKVFLDDLQQFAAATPFEFPELLQASQRLLAMGFAAEDVKPTLTAIGDAVAALGGSGELVGRVTTALGQMQAKGKASAEEMNQLTEAGIPGWKFLAEAIGTDVAGAMDRVSKGAVDAETVIGAVVAGMNNDFGGMMEKQSKTFGGLLSTLKDTFTQVSGTVMQPLFALVTDGLASIVAWTSRPEFAEGVAKFAENVRSFVETATTNITGLVSSLSGTFNTIYGTIITTIGWIRLAWDTDWGAIRTTWTNFATDMPALHAAFWEEWKKTFQTGSSKNVNDWEDFLGASSEKITDFWRLAIVNWTEGLRIMRGIGQTFNSLYVGDWAEMWDGMKLAFTSFTEVIFNLVEYVFGPGLRDKFAGALTTTFNASWELLKGFWETLSSWWNSAFGALTSFGSFPEMPSLSSIGGGFGSSTSNVTTGPINLNFNGPVDQQTIRGAGATLRDELRQRGAN